MSHIRRSLPLAVILLAAAVAMTVSPPPAQAAETYLPGIDVSHWQGEIDWARVRADGVRFAFVKATEDDWFVDNRYVSNRNNAEAARVLVGAYHFAQPSGSTADAVAQADHFLATAELKGRHLLPVLDLEVDNGLGQRKLRRWAKAWLARVHQRLGVKALIYTSPSFWRDYIGDKRWFADNGYRLWIAQWTSADEPLVPAQNWGGRGWTVWQHSSKGSIDGISGNVDLNRYNGTRLGQLRIKNNR